MLPLIQVNSDSPAGGAGKRLHRSFKPAECLYLRDGFTKAIVLYSSLFKIMDQDEIQFILGHEMGHVKLGHTWLRILQNLLSLRLLYSCWTDVPVVKTLLIVLVKSSVSSVE